jgi:hypothetical protein
MTDDNNQPLSPASRFNAIVLGKMQKAFNKNQEVDLTSVIPLSYAARLAERKEQQTGELSQWKNTTVSNYFSEETSTRPKSYVPTVSQSSTDTTVLLSLFPDDPPLIKFPLSDALQNLLWVSGLQSTQYAQEISQTLPKVIRNGEVLWHSEVCANNMVVKCNPEIVVKIVPNKGDTTEFTSLQYLAQKVPDIPAPKPLGLIVIGDTSYIFISFIPGETLDKVWSTMSENQKNSISDQLNELFLELRQLQAREGMHLGGVSGEGCKIREGTPVSASHLSATVQNLKISNSQTRILGVLYISDSCAACYQIRRRHMCSRMETYSLRTS